MIVAIRYVGRCYDGRMTKQVVPKGKLANPEAQRAGSSEPALCY
jgi:hypothetical protein